MNAITYETASSASVSELAGVFKLCCQQLYGGGRKLTNLLGGGNGLQFFTPESDPVFGRLESDAPSFSVGASLPATTFMRGSKSSAVVQMYVFDVGASREVRFYAPYAFGEKGATQTVLARVAAAVEAL